MRRKPGALLPLEVSICEVAIEQRRQGEPESHGFAIAKLLAERDGARRLTAHGTLYKALGRLEAAGLLQSRWEDPETAAHERRPPRRLYQITAAGIEAMARIAQGDPAPLQNDRSRAAGTGRDPAVGEPVSS